MLEVISDDCDGLYHGQPKCTATIGALSALGFAPLTPILCRPANAPRARRWRTTSWGCETNVVFSRRDAPPLPASLLQYHEPAMNGCHATTVSLDAAPPHALVMVGARRFQRAGAGGGAGARRSPSQVLTMAGVERYLCLKVYT